MNAAILQLMQNLKKHTDAARLRTGNPHVSVQVEGGLSQVVISTPMENGVYDIKILTPMATHEETIAALATVSA